MHEMLGRVSKILDGHPKLIDRFNRLLPPSLPLSRFMHAESEVFIFSVQCICVWTCVNYTSDVKRGQNLEAEAKASRPRPGL